MGWNHPIKGLINPNDFIPLSEEIGIIDKIDVIVFTKVCNQIKKWTDEGKNLV